MSRAGKSTRIVCLQCPAGILPPKGESRIPASLLTSPKTEIWRWEDLIRSRRECEEAITLSQTLPCPPCHRTHRAIISRTTQPYTRATTPISVCNASILSQTLDTTGSSRCPLAHPPRIAPILLLNLPYPTSLPPARPVQARPTMTDKPRISIISLRLMLPVPHMSLLSKIISRTISKTTSHTTANNSIKPVLLAS